MSDPILYGAAYYPEDWPKSERAYDIKMMKEAGMNVMRFAEFAWNLMEPEEGRYDFVWLHEVVDELAANGIKSILGTPTATPPRWFLLKYPEGARLEADGFRVSHGFRRHCCSNNPDYQRVCAGIVEAMAKEFGSDPNVIGWQLDNEIYSWNDGCCCPICEAKFQEFLEARYGTIEKLNESWDLNVFSQAFRAFKEISIPVHGWFNPHIKLAWAQFRYDSDIAFIHSHRDILKKYTDAPIGTDMMPVNGMGYEAMTAPMDVIQFNHYNTEDNLPKELPFWFDHFRSFGKPFWCTETATGWNGGTAVEQVMKAEGFCRINAWMPVALGGEANLYWHWRQHWGGHEVNHSAVLYANGQPMHTFGEVRQIAGEFQKAQDVLRETKVDTQIGFHFTSLAWQLNQVQQIVSGFDYYQHLTEDFYTPLTQLGIRPNILGAKAALEDYKVIFTHLTMSLEDDDLGDRIEQWVRNGGIWVVGPMTDIRHAIGTHYIESATGRIERMTGVRLTDSLPGNGKYLPSVWTDGEPLALRYWQELYTPTDKGEVLAAVTGGWRSRRANHTSMEFLHG